ncbi:MAG: tRNA pseudouridine(55) synthase TruB [Desulfitobacterium sp.]|nr:tRNA pseudouridine(55) synthase TruB [Desulfitobacterium sp.]
MDGIINVLKPVGMTSSDVVMALKKILKTKKVGHTGTLDPDVSGVLPICVGKATRLAEYLVRQGKSYKAEITFGIVTTTQDGSGEVLEENSPKVSQEDFNKIAPRFLGTIQQIPPMYSAVRHKGKHLYELARKGIEVERSPREVEIDRIELLEWIPGTFPKGIFEVDCSKGTYIRTLCHDIGQALGCGAHMSHLIRLSSGPFKIEESIPLDSIKARIGEGDFSFFVPMEQTLDLVRVNLSPERGEAFRKGLATARKQIEGVENIDESEEVQVFCEGQFLGIGIWRNQALCPRKVF